MQCWVVFIACGLGGVFVFNVSFPQVLRKILLLSLSFDLSGMAPIEPPKDVNSAVVLFPDDFHPYGADCAMDRRPKPSCSIIKSVPRT